MTEVSKLMRTNADGTEAQIYPETHAEAVLNLDSYIASHGGGTGSAGSKGDKGDKGDAGLSAYQVAVQDGYKGTEAQWITSLKGATGPAGGVGPKGDVGPTGLQGAAGAKGATGDKGATGAAGTNATTTAAATQTANGLMAAADKKKLDTVTVLKLVKVKDV